MQGEFLRDGDKNRMFLLKEERLKVELRLFGIKYSLSNEGIFIGLFSGQVVVL